MKRNFTFLVGLFVLVFSVSTVAQVKPLTPTLPQNFENITLGEPAINDANRLPSAFNPHIDQCGFNFMMQQAKANGFNDELFEQMLQQVISERAQAKMEGAPVDTFYLPVVFHILYDGNSEGTIGTGANISQALVNAQLRQLNTDFGNMSGSSYAVAEDMGIRFVPARTDMTGNLMCEPGINRINWRSKGWTNPNSHLTTTAVQNYYNGTVKPGSIWNPEQYLNIWVANFSQSGLLGFATFPTGSGLPGLFAGETNANAGVVILSGSVGSLDFPGSTSGYNYGRTLTHELGHFFGLRHIWGDGACATDYCDDTPPQSSETTGCPNPGVLNGCTPSVPKMFQNYMDYSSDNCLNTFTLNQSERCQAVMSFSPRRVGLKTSTKGDPPPSNRVHFFSTQYSVIEETFETCPGYTDYLLPIAIDGPATGNATVSVIAGGTATAGQDYDLIPSSVNYIAGDDTATIIRVRLYNDAIVEGLETLQLQLSVTGTGVSLATTCTSENSCLINIFDDDQTTTINQGGQVVVFSQNFGTASGNPIPTGWTLGSAAGTQNKWCINSQSAAGWGFTGNTLHVTNGSATQVNNGTAALSYSSTELTDLRAFTPAINATGLTGITLSIKLISNGQVGNDYGVVYYSLDNTNFSSLEDNVGNIALTGINAGAVTRTFELPSNVVGNSNLRFLFRWVNNDDFIAVNPPFAIDDIVVSASSVGVETSINNAAAANLTTAAGESFFYSTSSGNVIAKIQNVSENVGCVEATVGSAGNGTTAIQTDISSYQRSQKVIHLVSASANTTADYMATFYFTTDELAAWGVNAPNLKIMKVADGVNLSSVLTDDVAEILSPTFDDLRATFGYATYTVNVTSGFSQFMLVSPETALPVGLLSFDAVAKTNHIQLQWATSTENNNKGFVIERSTDGQHYNSIGWVDGAINSSRVTQYNFADRMVDPGVLYYYRLRQTDLNLQEKLSTIETAKINGQFVQVLISPNPTKDQIHISTAGVKNKINISLFNASGQLVKTWRNLEGGAASKTLSLQGIAAGVYSITVWNKEIKSSQKIVIQP